MRTVRPFLCLLPGISGCLRAVVISLVAGFGLVLSVLSVLGAEGVGVEGRPCLLNPAGSKNVGVLGWICPRHSVSPGNGGTVPKTTGTCSGAASAARSLGGSAVPHHAREQRQQRTGPPQASTPPA
jgi:hypothetical protein